MTSLSSMPKCTSNTTPTLPSQTQPTHSDVLCFLQNYTDQQSVERLTNLLQHNFTDTQLELALDLLVENCASDNVHTQMDDCQAARVMRLWQDNAPSLSSKHRFYTFDLRSLPLSIVGDDNAQTQNLMLQSLTLQVNHQKEQNESGVGDEQASNTTTSSSFDVTDNSANSLLFANNNTNTSCSIAASSPESPAPENKAIGYGSTKQAGGTPTSSLEMAVQKILKRKQANSNCVKVESQPTDSQETETSNSRLRAQFSLPIGDHKPAQSVKQQKRNYSSETHDCMSTPPKKNDVEQCQNRNMNVPGANVGNNWALLSQMMSASGAGGPMGTSTPNAQTLFPNLAALMNVNNKSAGSNQSPSTPDSGMSNWLNNYYMNLSKNATVAKQLLERMGMPANAHSLNMFAANNNSNNNNTNNGGNNQTYYPDNAAGNNNNTVANSSPLLAQQLMQSTMNGPMQLNMDNMPHSPEMDTSPGMVSPADSINNVIASVAQTRPPFKQPALARKLNKVAPPSPETDIDYSGEIKPYRCVHPNCTKTFANKFLLKKHTFIHTGERPHACPYCSKRFNRKDNLLRHKKTHLANSLQPSTRRRHSTVFGVDPYAVAGLQAPNNEHESPSNDDNLSNDMPIDCSNKSPAFDRPGQSALDMYQNMMSASGVNEQSPNTANFSSMMEKMLRESVQTGGQ